MRVKGWWLRWRGAVERPTGVRQPAERSTAVGCCGTRCAVWRRLGVWWELARPFTLLAPAVGVASGAIAALGAWPRPHFGMEMVGKTGLAMAMAVTLNAASNYLNQVCDLTADRVNKPQRPLPSGRVSRKRALAGSIVLYCAGLAEGWAVGKACFLLGATAAFASCAYSSRPFRTKRSWVSANLTIGAARGLLLIVAGWSAVKSVTAWEPWYTGGVLALFLFGAATAKDFQDVPGDLLDGSYTLPVRYGERGAVKVMLPFLCLPFLLLPLGGWVGILSADGKALGFLGGGMFIWGLVLGARLLVAASLKATGQGRSAWVQMYLMLMASQLGWGAAYWI